MTNSINVTGSSPWGTQDSILIKFWSKTNLFIFPLLVFTTQRHHAKKPAPKNNGNMREILQVFDGCCFYNCSLPKPQKHQF